MNKEVLKYINVLYVEDEQEVREFTTKTINNIVNEVIPAENGEDGLEKYYKNNNINLILTDINMPKMGGLQMCKEIRKTNKEIPIIITTAHSDPEFLKDAINVNVSSYAMKPINLYHLVEGMIKAIEPIFLKKSLNTITKNSENKIDEISIQTKNLLDQQENIVLLTNFSQILEVNNKFLEFFGVDSYSQFLQTKGKIVDQFKEDKRFYNKAILQSKDHWILDIQKLTELDRVVKMENSKGEDRIFIVNIDNFEPKEDHFIVSFIDITSLKEKSKLLEYQASHDQSTGFFNREKFNDIFTKEIKRDKRYKNELSLLILSIDNFEDLQKTYFEQIEEIIQSIAKVIMNNVREHDIIGRWTLDQFILLLPQTDLDGAEVVSKKINNTLKENNFMNIDINTSFGISTLQGDDDEITILERVEKSLEKSKEENSKN